MDITSINTQNAINFNKTPELRFPETAWKASVSAAAPGTDKTAPSDIELRQKAGENAEKGITAEKLDNNQAEIEDMFSKSIRKANKKLEPMSVEFAFSYHEKTGYVNVKIINSDTKEVVREIPSQKALDMLAKVWELAGIIVDDKK